MSLPAAAVAALDLGEALEIVTAVIADVGLGGHVDSITASRAREFFPPHPLAGTARIDVRFSWPAHHPAIELRDALRARADTTQVFTAGRCTVAYLRKDPA